VADETSTRGPLLSHVPIWAGVLRWCVGPSYLGRIVVCPPIYGRSTSGIVSEPSSFW